VDHLPNSDLIQMSCGGVPFAWYDLDGLPDARNQPPYDQPLQVNEGIRAWDGTLLLPDPAPQSGG
jgi:hypothetical protein